LVAIPQDGRVTGLLAFGLLAGLYYFFKGFRVYREFRVEEDTPEIPIRSVAMGLVHVNGEAEPGNEGSVFSPVGRTPCLFYKVDIDHWSGDGERGNWRHWKTAWGGARFTLTDATGQVTIDGRGAQLMTGQNTQAVAGGMPGAATLDDDIDNDPYAPPDPYATPVSSGTSSQTAPTGAAASAQTMAAAGPPTDAELIEFAETAPGGVGGATGYYRLTEYVILGGWSYDIIGTYMNDPEHLDDLDRAAALKDPSYTPPPEPAPGAASDRKLIGKGMNEKTFVISESGRKATQAAMRHTSFIQVFGGAALAVVCLALLLSQFGLL
jgi:hypothetical protein